MKKLIAFIVLLGIATPAMADETNPKTLVEYCQIAKARKESRAFMLDVMKTCMSRGDGIKDWTDADDQVSECRSTALAFTNSYVNNESALSFYYAEFLRRGGNPDTCQFDKNEVN